LISDKTINVGENDKYIWSQMRRMDYYFENGKQN